MRETRGKDYINRLLQGISTYMNPLIFPSPLLEWCRPPHRSQGITSSLLCTPHWPCRHSNHLYLTSQSVRRFWMQIILIGHFYCAFFSTNHWAVQGKQFNDYCRLLDSIKTGWSVFKVASKLMYYNSDSWAWNHWLRRVSKMNAGKTKELDSMW